MGTVDDKYAKHVPPGWPVPLADGSGPQPEEKKHRLDWMDLTKFVIGLLVVVLTAWWALGEKFSERPTTKIVDIMLEKHERGSAHPAAQRQINEIKFEQRTIRESQIRQEVTGKEQTKVLETIREDLKFLRRRSR